MNDDRRCRTHPEPICAPLATDEQMFDNTEMLTIQDLQSIQRSAAMAPLSAVDASRLVEACDQLLRERTRIVELLADLPSSWANVRKMLNELQSVLG
jgi:hypothetical protein